MLARLRSFAAAALGRRRLEQDLVEEIGFHLDSRVDDLVAAGMTPAGAAEQARREFGSMASYRDQCREARGLRWLDDARADVVYAARTLRRTPAFAVAAIVSLALGIGANTFVFSVVNKLLLEPLPVADPDCVVFVQSTGSFVAHSFPNYRDFRDRNVAFDGLIAYRMSPMNVEAPGGGAIRSWGYLASGNYFDVLGVRPFAGRFFHQSDDVSPGASPYAVLAYGFWRSRFSGDASIVGSTVRINGLPYTVLGVAPPGFHGTELFYRPALWVPITMQAQIEVGNPWLEVRNTFNTWVAGRLKAGVTVAQAEANLNAIAADLAKAFPRANDRLHVKLTRPGLVGDALGGPVRAFTLGVLLLAGLVLLAACANLASTLAARGADRQRELAIRLSIGAGHGRIVRQLLTETTALAAAGGAAGAILATTLARALSAWQLPTDLPVQFDVQPDARVFVFAFAVSIAAGLLFGLMPARQAARASPAAALKAGPEAGTHGRRLPFRDALIAVQVALCFVLVAACLLSLRGLQRATTLPLGFDPKNATVVGYELGLAGYTREQGEAFQQRVLDEVSRLPGVEHAADANSVPLSVDQSTTTVFPDDGSVTREGGRALRNTYEVSPGFFDALCAPLVRGRDFTWHDTAGAPRVAIVNETFARAGVSPDRRRRAAVQLRLAGAADGSHRRRRRRQVHVAGRSAVGGGVRRDSAALQHDARADRAIAHAERHDGGRDSACRGGDRSEHAVYQTGSLEDILGLALFPTRAAAIALGSFGLLAMVLAATGIHGVVAYAVRGDGGRSASASRSARAGARCCGSCWGGSPRSSAPAVRSAPRCRSPSEPSSRMSFLACRLTILSLLAGWRCCWRRLEWPRRGRLHENRWRLPPRWRSGPNKSRALCAISGPTSQFESFQPNSIFSYGYLPEIPLASGHYCAVFKHETPATVILDISGCRTLSTMDYVI